MQLMDLPRQPHMLHQPPLMDEQDYKKFTVRCGAAHNEHVWYNSQDPSLHRFRTTHPMSHSRCRPFGCSVSTSSGGEEREQWPAA